MKESMMMLPDGDKNGMLRSVTGLLSVIMVVMIMSGCETLQEIVASADKPSASVEGVQLQDLGLDGVTLGFDVKVTNPYGVSLPLANIDYQLFEGGGELVSGSAPLSGSIPRYGSKVVTIPAHVDFQNLFNSVSGLKPGAVVPYTAKLGLSVDAPVVGRLALPLETSGEFPIPAVPDVSVESINWENLSLTKASALMKVRIGNTNSFPVDLNSFKYGLSLAGKDVISSSVREGVSFGVGDANTLDIPISVSPIDMGLAFFNMLKGSGSGYSLGGSMELGTPFGDLDIPFETAGNTVFNR